MSGRILMGCYEVPGYGGAATGTYRLFEKLQGDGLPVSYLNLIDEQDAEYLLYRFGASVGNPRHLEDVSNCVLEAPLFGPQPGLARRIEAEDPSLLVADDYIAALLMKRAAPERRLLFMTAGLAQVVRYLEERGGGRRACLDGFRRASHGGLHVFHAPERSAMEAADLILTHSDLIRDLVLATFPDKRGKVCAEVVWRAEWVAEEARPFLGLARPFEERDIDVLFVASSWSRPEKNLPLLRRIVARCPGLRIHVVGETPRPVRGATCHGLVTEREALFGLLARSRSFVSPSRFDPAPHVLWEASLMGCNVVASTACGNWRLCHDTLLARPDDADDFAAKIAVSLRQKLEDHMASFLASGSYADLFETIQLEAEA